MEHELKSANEMLADSLNSFEKQVESKSPPVPCKYNEDEVLNSAIEYIRSTYAKHYSSADGIQTLDLIDAVGDAPAFCRSNACLLYTSPSPRDATLSRMPSSA